MKKSFTSQLAAWLMAAGLAACSDGTTTVRQLTPGAPSRIVKAPITVTLCKVTGFPGQTYSFDATIDGVAAPSVGLTVGQCVPVLDNKPPADIQVTETSATPDSIVAIRTGGTTADDTVKVAGPASLLVSTFVSNWTINVYNPLPPGAKTEVCKITGMPGQTYTFTVGVGFGPTTPLVLPTQTCQVVYSAPTTATPVTTVAATETSATPDSIVATLAGDLTGASTIRVTNGAAATVPASGTAGWSIKFYNPLPPPTAACAAITAVQGVAITPVTLIGTGGTGAPYTFTATGLPTGLSISSSGTISGTPTVSGTFPYTVTVTDKDGHSGTFSCSVTVNGAPTTSCVAITAVQGVAITPATMVGSGGTGGPYTFSATGLPAGLSMSTDGTISGTPTVSGTFNYTVTVTDKDGHSGTFNCSIVVNGPPSTSCVAITAVQGVAITQATMVGSGGTGGPYTFSATGLPAGLSMSSDGTISGTPTVSGTFTYTVTVTDKDGHSGTFNCSIVVNGPPTTTCVAITAVQGVAITPATMTGSGGAGGPYTFSASGLPAGLTMSSTGTISGTPTVSGTFPYTVTVTDKAGNKGTFNCSVTVNGPPTATCASISAVQGSAITAVTLIGSGGTGGPYTFSATGLPAGLTMSSSGTISGTPTVSGTFSYTVTVTDKDGHSGTFHCTVTVLVPPCPQCTSITVLKGTPMTPTQLSGAGGSGGPYTYSNAIGLPAGLTISSTGVLSGTTTAAPGTYIYTVTVTDKDGHKGTFTCTIIVVYDGTAPVCAVYESATIPYMSFQDVGSGIVRLDVVTNLNNNFNVTLTPTPTGTTFLPAITSQPARMPTGTVIKFPTPQTTLFKVYAQRYDSRYSAQLTVKATDAAGHTVTCDPVQTTVTTAKQDDGDQTFTNLPYDEHFVRIESGGLKMLDLIVNGTTFKVKRLDDNEVRVVDVSSAMKHSNTNTITISPKGKKGETAQITIGPSGS